MKAHITSMKIFRFCISILLLLSVSDNLLAQNDSSHYHVHSSDHHQTVLTDTAQVEQHPNLHHWAPLIHSHSGRLPAYIALPEPGLVGKKEDDE